VLASRDRNVIKRNMAALPAYSFILGLLALLGYMAIAAKITPITNDAGKADANTIVPLLFDNMFPSWFAGVAFAAIGIGALVPAAIMSIAAANLWTRNIYVEYINKDATPKQEARSSKLASLVVKIGALVAILALDPQFSIDLQLIGGIIILQTLPAVALGLYTRWFHRWGLIAGWAAGMAVGFWTTYQIQQKVFNPDGTITIAKAHFGGSAFPLSKLGLDTDLDDLRGLPGAGRQPCRVRDRHLGVPGDEGGRRRGRHAVRTSTSPTRATRACTRSRRSCTDATRHNGGVTDLVSSAQPCPWWRRRRAAS
jgi:SSS family solute:Na+ symporter